MDRRHADPGAEDPRADKPGRDEPRRDTRGILDPARLLRRVRFRRHGPAPALRPYVEHYWLIDWDLDEPFAQHVLPHPAVNLVFQRYHDQPEFAELAGVGRRLFSIELDSTGRVCGVQFRPGGFRPFWRRSVSTLTGRQIPFRTDAGPVCAGTDDERCRALDAVLTGLDPRPDPAVAEAVRLVELIRRDRTVLRVEEFARGQGVSVRTLQRLFTEYVGVSPKWVILRYRLHEAIERATDSPDWAGLAADLGYSDQAHLIRDVRSAIGLPPAAYARGLA
ncbi:helix-turn-helix domain-containing protein [Micromonospora sp. NPDC049559]|uniref:helix-turn-helix domain-containing protein n=1 Tax=Micromonospora sp. NPDC049559 TaxID=3155923 RepID=UPI0034196F2F